MSQYSRRDFLTHSAAGALALASHGLLTNTAFAAEPAQMAIAKWSGAKDLNAEQIKEAAIKLTEKAIEGIGGLKQFVGKGSVVWIKPNIGWDRTPDKAANTNPDVVATLIRLCFDAGAKTVKVGDNPCNMPAKTYASSGIAEAAKQTRGRGGFSGQEPLQGYGDQRANESRASPFIRKFSIATW